MPLHYAPGNHIRIVLGPETPIVLVIEHRAPDEECPEWRYWVKVVKGLSVGQFALVREADVLGWIQSTYIRNPEGIARALAELRALMAHYREHPPTAEDLAWQDDLPELPADGTTEAVFFSRDKKAKD